MTENTHNVNVRLVTQDSPNYKDVKCYVKVPGAPGEWHQRVWLNKGSNEIVIGDVIMFADDADTTSYEVLHVPTKVSMLLTEAIMQAIKEHLEPEQKEIQRAIRAISTPRRKRGTQILRLSDKKGRLINCRVVIKEC